MTEAEFLRSMDFLKIGKAIQSENWQIAAMTAQRMTKNAQDAGVKEFDRQLTGLRQCINARQKAEAQNLLALITSKRVMLLNLNRAKENRTADTD